jgi:ribose-phosphate pyrophosphokinase
VLILPLPGNESFAAELALRLGAELGKLETRSFPDGESYVRIGSDVRGRDVVCVCTLARPDEQFLRLVFTARTARELGASRLTLVAPYLAYMRQDKAFHDGEAVTSSQFASLVSREFDRLVTIDPHLHRHRSLGEIYSIPADALHAAEALGEWIQANVERPLVIGPDSESEQWAAAVAQGAPLVVLRKHRLGDRSVEIEFPDLSAWRDRQPVLVDDIASSGRTLIEAAKGLASRGMRSPICLVVHAVFADDAFSQLAAAAARIVTTDTVPHPSNGVGVSQIVARALAAERSGSADR